MKRKASYFILFVALGMLVQVFYLIFWPVKVIDVSTPLPVKTLIVHPGEKVVYEFKYQKHMDLRADSIKTLKCPTSFQSLPSGYNKPVPVGEGTLELSDFIPLGVLPSKDCKIYISVEYKANFFKVIDYTFITEPFEIQK